MLRIAGTMITTNPLLAAAIANPLRLNRAVFHLPPIWRSTSSNDENANSANSQ